MMSLEMARSLRASWQIHEEPGFYIPDYLAGERGQPRPDLYAAADDQARDLRDAERCLDDALNLAGTLRTALEDVGDTRAMQVDTVLKIVEELLTRAHAAIDRHDTRFMNLFMAYFDREGPPRPAGSE